MKAMRLLMVLLAIMLTTSSALAEIISGSCGNNATYILDSESCLLKIEGTGKMNDFTIGSACYALTSVDIPSTVTYIDEFAFEDCKSLTSFTCRAPEPPRLGERVFDNVPQAIGTLYVPAKSVEAYKNADSWKDWGNIQALNSDDEDGIESIGQQDNESIVYDLQGRKVKNARNGLFIQNGKKVLMK